jgi:light-regulated signal transduction histidine kinase (bacteriophytochrome)
VRVVLADLAQSIAETGAHVAFKSLPAVRMNTIHLQQVFQNLISNSIKYHRPGVTPEIHITADRSASEWTFCVSDNGMGIEPKYCGIIFGLFKRLHGDEFQGTGLGLAICQRVVERYGGKIWVTSQASRGSDFHFTVPE